MLWPVIKKRQSVLFVDCASTIRIVHAKLNFVPQKFDFV
jgi:hypothetical protein